MQVGRDFGPPWDDDAYLNPKHATLTASHEGLLVEDHDSANGVHVKLEGSRTLEHMDEFRVGQEVLCYEDLPESAPSSDGSEIMGSPNPGYWGRVGVLTAPGVMGAAHPIEGDGIMIGREIGDLTFPSDGYVSGRHCRVYGDDDGVYIEDLGSSNGTYMRVRSQSTVPFGSLLLVGQKLFKVERP
jgi:predicted component of type VI protein secretion system